MLGKYQNYNEQLRFHGERFRDTVKGNKYTLKNESNIKQFILSVSGFLRRCKNSSKIVHTVDDREAINEMIAKCEAVINEFNGREYDNKDLMKLIYYVNEIKKIKESEIKAKQAESNLFALLNKVSVKEDNSVGVVDDDCEDENFYVGENGYDGIEEEDEPESTNNEEDVIVDVTAEYKSDCKEEKVEENQPRLSEENQPRLSEEDMGWLLLDDFSDDLDDIGSDETDETDEEEPINAGVIEVEPITRSRQEQIDIINHIINHYKMQKKTQADFCEKYGFPKRTVMNWKKNGCPDYIINMLYMLGEPQL